MSFKEIGQAALLVAFLLAAAGIIEPSAATSAAVAAILAFSFSVWVFKSHDEWRDGYAQGRYERKLSNIKDVNDFRTPKVGGSTLWKCGLPGCYCADDPSFREFAK